MKKILLVTGLTMITSASLLGAKVKHWSEVQTFDVASLEKNLGKNVGRVVAIKCNFRGKDIHHLKPNWYEGSLWQPNPTGKGFVFVRVMVAKKDLLLFKAITAEAQSADTMTLYGQVSSEAEANFLFVRLLGRRATVDSAGDATVDW